MDKSMMIALRALKAWWTVCRFGNAGLPVMSKESHDLLVSADKLFGENDAGTPNSAGGAGQPVTIEET